ncbi:hypothetical protein [Mycobacterium avium]|uniref:hypothetical protein n=1 Tax=Mycobacterium avium TaxID=1764 RepID=UPI0018C86E0E|nr:hypothetical protein [Mycobacterium avium]
MERERQNADDAASLLVELGRLAAVGEWEETRILEIRAGAERRQHEHRQACAAAVARMRRRGETLAAIVELAGVRVGDVRGVLKTTSAQAAAPRDALGAANGVSVSGADDRGAVDAAAVDGAAHALALSVAAAGVNGVGGRV